MDYGDIDSVEYAAPKYEGYFHCLEAGPRDAPTMVLLHGHMAHAIAFRRVWGRLSKRFRLLIPDLPGHGADETFRGLQLQPRIATLAEWLFDFLEISADGPVHLVGHSLGASVAYEAARLEPNRMCSLVLTSPGFCVSAPPGAAALLEHLPPGLVRMVMNRPGIRLLEPFRWQGEPMDAAEADAYVEPLKDIDRLEFVLRLGAEIVRESCKIDDLEPMAVPTLVLFGAGDDVCAVDKADQLGDKLHAQKVEIFSESGHSPPEDTPVEFVDALVDFIDESGRC